MSDNLGTMHDPDAVLRRALYKLPITYGGADGNVLAMIERVQDEFAQRTLALNDAQSTVMQQAAELGRVRAALAWERTPAAARLALWQEHLWGRLMRRIRHKPR